MRILFVVLLDPNENGLTVVFESLSLCGFNLNYCIQSLKRPKRVKYE
jgi:hypothetical protein